MTERPCLDEATLIDLAYGEAADAAACEAHLARCATCRQALAALRADLARLADPLPEGGGDRALATALRLVGTLGTTPDCRLAPPPWPGAAPSAILAGGAVGEGRSGGQGLETGAPRPDRLATAQAPGATGGDPEWMTLGEVADHLRLHPAQVQDLLGELPHLRLAGVVRVRRTTLQAWLEGKERESVGEARTPPRAVALKHDII